MQSSKTGSVRRVLMVSSGSLMDVAIEGLVGQGADVAMATVAYVDEPSFHRDVALMQPDVIVISGVDMLTITRLMDVLKDPVAMRVLFMRLDDNMVDVFEKHSVVVTQPQDLMALIGSVEPSA